MSAAYQLQLLRLARYVSAAEKAFYFLALNEMYPVTRHERVGDRSARARGTSVAPPYEKQVHRRPRPRCYFWHPALRDGRSATIGPSLGAMLRVPRPITGNTGVVGKGCGMVDRVAILRPRTIFGMRISERRRRDQRVSSLAF